MTRPNPNDTRPSGRTAKDERSDVCAAIQASIRTRKACLEKAVKERRLTRYHGEGEAQERVIDLSEHLLNVISAGQHAGATRSTDHVPTV